MWGRLLMQLGAFELFFYALEALAKTCVQMIHTLLSISWQGDRTLVRFFQGSRCARECCVSASTWFSFAAAQDENGQAVGLRVVMGRKYAHNADGDCRGLPAGLTFARGARREYP